MDLQSLRSSPKGSHWRVGKAWRDGSLEPDGVP